MHVAQISFFTDPQARAPDELLRAWPTLSDLADAAASAGARVTVIQASQHTQSVNRKGVSYHFLPAGTIERLIPIVAPDVFHVHGLDFPAEVLSLAALAPQTPMILHDHASRPPRWWRRGLWRRSFAAATGVAFCSREQAWPFESVRLIQSPTQVYEVPESTSRFTRGNREDARRATGTTGDPLLLFVGHLNTNKDPITVLDGVSEAARALPKLQLWCCFASAPLLKEVELRVADDPVLRDRVHLLGRVEHPMIERLMQAADVFVLGSHRESSGYSLIEALACGLPPVVTDIPSFRSLNDDGRIGRLWPCGDASALCSALLAIAGQPREEMRAAARAHFESELSVEAVGRKLCDMYDDVLRHRSPLQARHAP